jgi:light-regulated signal transduction histidine kinase (bacteriophytochrome)
VNTSKNSKLPQLDWTTVEQQPIHNPGSIQPHGVLLTLKEPELIITQISENSLHFLGFSPTRIAASVPQ